MNKLRLLLALTCSLMSTLAFSQQHQPIQKHMLANGLTVYLLEDHQVPKVTGIVVTRAGAKNDPSDATGMAHYMEHMLFKGTTELGTTNWTLEKPWIDSIFSLYDRLGQTRDEAERARIQGLINEASVKANEYAIPNELSNLIKECGGTGMNAGTGPDQTGFYNSFPPSEINKWLDLYSHRFLNPVFRSFQAELEVVYEEKNMYADNFGFNLIEKFQKSFFKKHPYGQQPMVGTIEHLKNPSLTKMLEFYKTWYVANNMALILVGDFNSKEVLPLITQKFSSWPSGQVPPARTWDEAPFNGREQVEYRLSPVKIGILGYRVPPQGDPDEFALKICLSLLNNPNSSGLLDKLNVDEKLLGASALQFPYNDLGAFAIIFIPKILGQSLEDAESLVKAQLEKLCKGEFEDWKFEAAKLSLYKQQQLNLEEADQVGSHIAMAFSQGKDPNEIYTWSDKIARLTKQDILAVANKYFGNNYLAFYSKMGSPKAEKIKKPPYTPVISKNNTRSAYAQSLLDQASGPVMTKPVDFNSDCHMEDLANGSHLYYTPNPANDIFTLDLKYIYDTSSGRVMDMLSELISFAGTETFPGIAFKEEFDKLGCAVSFFNDEHYFNIRLDGPENNLEKALILMKGLFEKPTVETSKMSLILEEAKATRKVEKSTPDGIAAALFDYVRYGRQSGYLDRPTLKQIKDMKSIDFLVLFADIVNHPAIIFYVGRMETPRLRTVLESVLPTKENLKPAVPLNFKELREYGKDAVFFTQVKKARQSKIFFYKKGPLFDNDQAMGIDAFNLYFGGDFSGLVLQEIREYRSYSYSAGAQITKPGMTGLPLSFSGFIGTQADKTNEAIQVFEGLVNEMPKKEERTDMIRKYLSLSLSTRRPTFRDIPQKVYDWKLLGYKADPTPGRLKTLESLIFDDIYKTYGQIVKHGAMVISIAGNKKSIDFKDLEKYGKMEKVKIENIFTD